LKTARNKIFRTANRSNVTFVDHVADVKELGKTRGLRSLLRDRRWYDNIFAAWHESSIITVRNTMTI